MVVADSPSAEPRPRPRAGAARRSYGYALAGRAARSVLNFLVRVPVLGGPRRSSNRHRTPGSRLAAPRGRSRHVAAGRAARRRAAPRAPPSIRRGAAPAPAAAPLPALSFDLEFLVGGRDTLRAAGPLGSAPFSRPGLGRATSRARASRPGPASRSGAHRGGSGALRTVSAGCTPNRAESSSLTISRVRNAVTAASRRRSR